jgi:inorganic pyrophosphatase
MNSEFWVYLQQLVDGHKIVIDRPKGSTHPRFAGRKYPVDYGYLASTTSTDMGGIDVWKGSLPEQEVVGVLLTVDLYKKDAEVKILSGCSGKEIKAILDFVNTDQMKAIFVKKELSQEESHGMDT